MITPVISKFVYINSELHCDKFVPDGISNSRSVPEFFGENNILYISTSSTNTTNSIDGAHVGSGILGTKKYELKEVYFSAYAIYHKLFHWGHVNTSNATNYAFFSKSSEYS